MGSTVDSPRSWVPYEPIKDCSQGFCSIYCPQWCYIIFPPPPPAFDFADDSSSSSSAFSPLVIAIIGILASGLLLVSYYTVISKYCGSFESLRRHLNGGNGGDGESGGDQLRRNEAWRMTVSEGLEESVIRSIAVCTYKKGDGFVDGTDCSVCLAEFREDEALRLLPKCSHAFHVQCIDTWLKSHSNCPLCRSVVVSLATALPAELPPTNPPLQEEMSQTQVANETVIAMEDAERGTQEENREFSKQPRRVPGELGHTAIGIGDEMFPPIRRSEVCRDRISIANVLEISMEEEGRSTRVAVSSGDEAAGSSSSSSVPMKKQ